MGRGKNKRRTRDVNTISNHRLRFDEPRYVTHTDHLANLTASINDGRLWQPEAIRSNRMPTTVVGSPAKVTRGNPQKPDLSVWSQNLSFERPHETSVCVRRKQRREVLFATRKTGQGGQKRPRWTEFSKIQCRRK